MRSDRGPIVRSISPWRVVWLCILVNNQSLLSLEGLCKTAGELRWPVYACERAIDPQDPPQYQNIALVSKRVPRSAARKLCVGMRFASHSLNSLRLWFLPFVIETPYASNAFLDPSFGCSCTRTCIGARTTVIAWS